MGISGSLRELQEVAWTLHGVSGTFQRISGSSRGSALECLRDVSEAFQGHFRKSEEVPGGLRSIALRVQGVPRDLRGVLGAF